VVRLYSLLQGLPTIRAYGAESAFQASFINHLSLNGSWWFAYLASSRWIGFRLDLIATVTLTVAVMLATALRQQVIALHRLVGHLVFGKMGLVL
jgi:ATP-binding cassette subfamily C (CFTR/MRP) protein 4